MSKLRDPFDLDKGFPSAYYGPYTNLKETENALDKDGMMHFTQEQVDAINLYRRTQKFDATTGMYN